MSCLPWFIYLFCHLPFSVDETKYNLNSTVISHKLLSILPCTSLCRPEGFWAPLGSCETGDRNTRGWRTFPQKISVLGPRWLIELVKLNMGQIRFEEKQTFWNLAFRDNPSVRVVSVQFAETNIFVVAASKLSELFSLFVSFVFLLFSCGCFGFLENILYRPLLSET